MTISIPRLLELAEKATPQKLDTSEMMGWGESDCPLCKGDGHVDINDYTNYDGYAIGVQFFGVGDAHINAEKYFRACSPETILALCNAVKTAMEHVKREDINTIRALRSALSPFGRE